MHVATNGAKQGKKLPCSYADQAKRAAEQVFTGIGRMRRMAQPIATLTCPIRLPAPSQALIILPILCIPVGFPAWLGR
jgi:hypothetical protein